jgi:glycerol-3-phosphate dehydrogenase subunit C
MDVIRGQPTPGLTYDPNDPKYWDESALKGEINRVYEICHGCRLCFNLCPSFPELFHFVDHHGGDVRALTQAEHNRVVDTCYQCKLCYVKCPYTPDDGHEFQLDFPRLMLRANAVRKKETGVGLRAKLLSHPEELARVGGLTPGLANWANRQPLLRRLAEATIGIHREKILPEFQPQTFSEWLKRQPAPQGDTSKAVLFTTCFVEHYNPQIAKDAVSVYAKSGIALTCPKQNCCGMPALEAGDVELAKKLAASNVESLLPAAEQGKKIVAINPTCSYMLRKEYGELVGTEAARKVSMATMDLSEFLFELKREGKFNRDFKSTPGRIGYHLPCHLKAQNIGFRSRDMMKLIPHARIQLVEQCSGHDGTWAMKKEFFPLSMLTGRKAFEEMKNSSANVLASDCPMAAIQFEQALGTRPIHPIQVLARAYEPDGFPQRIEEQQHGQQPTNHHAAR